MCIRDSPNREKREKGSYDLLFCADIDDTVTKASVVGDMDPGYGSTSKMIVESTICLLKDVKDTEGGIYTPASLFGLKLAERLEQNAGITFKID